MGHKVQTCVQNSTFRGEVLVVTSGKHTWCGREMGILDNQRNIKHSAQGVN
jgi:hypothetical protein